MWRMFLISLGVHAFVFFMWGFRFNSNHQIENAPLIIEFKNIGDVTRAPKIGKVLDADALKDQPKKPEEQPPEEKKEDMVKESKPDPKPKEKTELEKLKEEKKLEPKKEEVSLKKPDPKKRPELKKEKPKEKAKPKKKLDKAEVQLKKDSKKGDNKKKPDTKKAKAALDNLLGDDDVADSGANEIGNELSASYIDAMRSKIKQCWIVPVGIENAKDMAVEIHMELSEDGFVKSASVVDKSRYAKDPYFKIAAEAAYRAALDESCQPFLLPKDKYKTWKEIEMTFDPREMF